MKAKGNPFRSSHKNVSLIWCKERIKCTVMLNLYGEVAILNKEHFFHADSDEEIKS
jgi:hypothetical protein